MVKTQPLNELDTASSTEFKKSGLRIVLERLKQSREGALRVMNHQRPEAVLLTTERYEQLLQLAEAHQNNAQDALATLRQEFDKRLEGLNAMDVGDRVRTTMDKPIRLNGEVRVGDSH